MDTNITKKYQNSGSDVFSKVSWNKDCEDIQYDSQTSIYHRNKFHGDVQVALVYKTS